MPAPVIIEHVAYTIASTSASVTLPTAISAGDLLLMRLASWQDVSTPPSGWTEFVTVPPSLASNLHYHCYVKRATGSEGATESVVFAARTEIKALTTQYQAGSWYDPGGVLTTDTAVASSAVPYTSSTATFDPPSLDPGWDGDDALTCAIAVTLGTADPSVYPAGYFDTQTVGNAFSPTLAVAFKETVGIEDPGAYTFPSITGFALTTMIRGVAGGGGGLFFGAGF